MLEVVEKLLDPIRIRAGEDLEVGDIVSISYEPEVRCYLSGSNNPFGIVVGPSDEWGNVLVMCSTSILKTDNYDLSEDYLAGDLLYSNEIGILTKSKCEENSILLGHVLSPPKHSGDALEISWI